MNKSWTLLKGDRKTVFSKFDDTHVWFINYLWNPIKVQWIRGDQINATNERARQRYKQLLKEGFKKV